MASNDKLTPFQKYPTLQAKFKILRNQQNTHYTLFEEMRSVPSGYIYITDLIVEALLNRSLNLVDAIINLINQWNFISAAPLLRLQIDNLLKLIHLALNENREEICLKILKGIRFDKIKDTNGKFLKDIYLREQAKQLYPWLDKVYEETSKLIHFSEKHCYSTITSINNKNRTIEYFFGVGSPHWPKKEIENFLDALLCVNDELLKVIKGWVITKASMEKTFQVIR